MLIINTISIYTFVKNLLLCCNFWQAQLICMNFEMVGNTMQKMSLFHWSSFWISLKIYFYESYISSLCLLLVRNPLNSASTFHHLVTKQEADMLVLRLCCLYIACLFIENVSRNQDYYDCHYLINVFIYKGFFDHVMLLLWVLTELILN